MSNVQLPAGYADVKEPEAVAEGLYEIRVIEAVMSKTKATDIDMLVLELEILGQTNTKIFKEYFVFPVPGDEWFDFQLLTLKKMLSAFSIPVDEGGNFDVDTISGSTCETFLKVEISDEYGTQNKVKYWPKLK